MSSQTLSRRALLTGAASLAAAPPSRPPNVLFFFAESALVAHYEINDFGATPGMVSLRLAQALEIAREDPDAGQTTTTGGAR